MSPMREESLMNFPKLTASLPNILRLLCHEELLRDQDKSMVRKVLHEAIFAKLEAQKENEVKNVF